MPNADNSGEKRHRTIEAAGPQGESMEADDWLENKVNRRIEGDVDPLDEDDQQRLEQQQLDVNRTSDTDTDEEMRRWSSAKRE
jgi:hypothetical protein